MRRMRCLPTQLGPNTLRHRTREALSDHAHESEHSKQPPLTTNTYYEAAPSYKALAFTHQSVPLFPLEFDTFCSPVFNDAVPTSFVALVPHATTPACSSTEMVLALQYSGAAAVIFAETATKRRTWWPILIPESDSDSQLSNLIQIPSVFTGYAEYHALMRIMQDKDFSDQIWIRIVPDPSGIYLLYILLVFTWPLIFVALLETNLYLKKRWLTRNALKAIHGMRVRVVCNENTDLGPRSVDQDLADTTCSVCLEEYATGEEIRILPCNHEFHAKCVDKWLTSEVGVCPLCKQSIHPPGHGLISDLDMLHLSDEEQDLYGQPSDSHETDAIVPSLDDFEY
ncbi:hypothetical protein HDU81_005421 [Chytriomyces hyalinus]|nr:hypothetical protein HDU81_005421 [Chytriomyces hyalinus]